METKVIKLTASDADQDVLAEAAALLDAGGLVAFPTETVYGIGCRVAPDSLERLDRVKERTQDKFYTLHIGDPGRIARYVPDMTLRPRSLVRKGWPGPLTIVFQVDEDNLAQLRQNLGRGVCDALYHDGFIGVRCPSNPIAAGLLEKATGAIVAPSANVTGKQPATDAAGVLAQLDGRLDMVLDGGPCRYGRSSTVVKTGSAGLEVLREGVYSKLEVEQMAQVQFLFVCSGNSCRSPMAEGLFRKYLAQKLGCQVDQLEAMGYKVLSAGTLGIENLAASTESVIACAARDVDIRSHASRGLSRELIAGSDLVFGMERHHVAAVLEIAPDAAGRCRLLAENGVGDPIGQPQQVYDRCADLIEEAVVEFVSELKI